MKHFLIGVSIAIVFSVSAEAFAAPVEMSKSKICHDSSSRWNGKLATFKPFETMADCILAGGREPKRKTKSKDGWQTREVKKD